MKRLSKADMPLDEDLSAMPRDSHLCDPLVTPVPNHAMYGRVDGVRAVDTLAEVAV